MNNQDRAVPQVPDRFNIEDSRLYFLHIIKDLSMFESRQRDLLRPLRVSTGYRHAVVYSFRNIRHLSREFHDTAEAGFRPVERLDISETGLLSELWKGIIPDGQHAQPQQPIRSSVLNEALGTDLPESDYHVEMWPIPELRVSSNAESPNLDPFGVLLILWDAAEWTKMSASPGYENQAAWWAVRSTTHFLAMQFRLARANKVSRALLELSGESSVAAAAKLLSQERYFAFAHFLKEALDLSLDTRDVNLLTRSIQAIYSALLHPKWVEELLHQRRISEDSRHCYCIGLLEYACSILDAFVKDFDGILRRRCSEDAGPDERNETRFSLAGLHSLYEIEKLEWDIVYQVYSVIDRGGNLEGDLQREPYRTIENYMRNAPREYRDIANRIKTICDDFKKACLTLGRLVKDVCRTESGSIISDGTLGLILDRQDVMVRAEQEQA